MEDLTESTIPILLLGDAGCGKSTFLSRIISPLNTTTQPTLRDLDQPFPLSIRFSRTQSYTLELSDTNSPTSYTLLTPSVVIICYDITSRASLLSAKDRWRNEATVHFQARGDAASEKIPVMLLGLKRELRGEEGDMVYPEEAHRVAAEMRCDRYAECSAVTGELIKEVLEDVSRMAVMTTKDGGGQSQGPSCEVI